MRVIGSVGGGGPPSSGIRPVGWRLDRDWREAAGYHGYLLDVYRRGRRPTAYLNGKSSWNTAATLIAFVSAGHVDTEEVGFTSVTNNAVMWDGLTTDFTSNGCITYATARLNDYFTNGYSAGKRQPVAAHELGHTIGLGDLGGGAELMNGGTCGTDSRWCSYFINTPERDDVNGINAIY